MKKKKHKNFDPIFLSRIKCPKIEKAANVETWKNCSLCELFGNCLSGGSDGRQRWASCRVGINPCRESAQRSIKMFLIWTWIYEEPASGRLEGNRWSLLWELRRQPQWGKFWQATFKQLFINTRSFPTSDIAKCYDLREQQKRRRKTSRKFLLSTKKGDEVIHANRSLRRNNYSAKSHNMGKQRSERERINVPLRKHNGLFKRRVWNTETLWLKWTSFRFQTSSIYTWINKKVKTLITNFWRKMHSLYCIR